MKLSEVTFVVTDTETTGTRPDHNRIIEIGAAKVRDGKIVDTFRQLINPGVAIPYQITRLTGITNSMVYGKPAAPEVLDSFMQFLGDDVFVAHNVRFDRRFVNAELRRSGRTAMENKSLCTARLARRLLAGLRSKGLTSLADFYGITIVNRHRAFDDAEATAKVLIRLLDKVLIQHESPSLSDVLLLQMKPYRSARPQPPHIKQIKKTVLKNIPQRAGVYFMHDSSGDTIYVGKAKNLKSRVRSYFNAIEAHPPRTRELLKTVRNVTWAETGNELSALLKESRLIKQLQPRFNRALKNYGRKPFIKLTTNSEYPTVESTHQLVDDGAEYYGPVRGGRYARFLIEIISQVYQLRECDDATLAAGRPCMYHDIGRCCAPCLGDRDHQYHSEVDRVRAFLRGDDGDLVISRLEERMQAAAAGLHFEEARRYRDSITRLTNLFAKQRIIAADVMDHNAAIVLPDDNTRLFRIFLVRFGRLAGVVTANPDDLTAAHRDVTDAIQRVYTSEIARPERYRKEEIDEVRILTHWLFQNRDSTSSVHLRDASIRDDTESDFVERVMGEIKSTIPSSEPDSGIRSSKHAAKS